MPIPVRSRRLTSLAPCAIQFWHSRPFRVAPISCCVRSGEPAMPSICKLVLVTQTVKSSTIIPVLGHCCLSLLYLFLCYAVHQLLRSISGTSISSGLHLLPIQILTKVSPHPTSHQFNLILRFLSVTTTVRPPWPWGCCPARRMGSTERFKRATLCPIHPTLRSPTLLTPRRCHCSVSKDEPYILKFTI